MCGEQWLDLTEGPGGLGSPPRVRGTDALYDAEYCHHGITPACAGNRPLPLRRSPLFGDHPRVCGEQDVYINSPGGDVGSPPRVRGTGMWDSMARRERRITPACAGNRP